MVNPEKIDNISPEPDPEVEKFSITEFLANLGNIDESDFDDFRDENILPKMQKIFNDMDDHEKSIFIAINRLDDNKLERLKELAINNAHLPGIHDVRNRLGHQYFLTDDKRYLIEE